MPSKKEYKKIDMKMMHKDSPFYKDDMDYADNDRDRGGDMSSTPSGKMKEMRKRAAHRKLKKILKKQT